MGVRDITSTTVDRTKANAEITEDVLIRLLQTGYVLEGVVEARSSRHNASIVSDRATRELLKDAQEESRRHRRRLGTILKSLEAESSSPQRIATLVESQYDHADIDGQGDILRDQLQSELSAYQFYESLLAAIRNTRTDLSIDLDELVSVLEAIRDEELEGVCEMLYAIQTREERSSAVEFSSDG